MQNKSTDLPKPGGILTGYLIRSGERRLQESGVVTVYMYLYESICVLISHCNASVDQKRAPGWPTEDTGGRRLSRRGWKGFVVTLSIVVMIVLEASAAQDVGVETVRMVLFDTGVKISVLLYCQDLQPYHSSATPAILKVPYSWPSSPKQNLTRR